MPVLVSVHGVGRQPHPGYQLPQVDLPVIARYDGDPPRDGLPRRRFPWTGSVRRLQPARLRLPQASNAEPPADTASGLPPTPDPGVRPTTLSRPPGSRRATARAGNAGCRTGRAAKREGRSLFQPLRTGEAWTPACGRTPALTVLSFRELSHAFSFSTSFLYIPANSAASTITRPADASSFSLLDPYRSI